MQYVQVCTNMSINAWYINDRCIQLCLVDMPEALYLSCRYSQLLVVLDVQSYFIFARPIPSMVSVSDNVSPILSSGVIKCLCRLRSVILYGSWSICSHNLDALVNREEMVMIR